VGAAAGALGECAHAQVGLPLAAATRISSQGAGSSGWPSAMSCIGSSGVAVRGG
jgi:hypothetical protein